MTEKKYCPLDCEHLEMPCGVCNVFMRTKLKKDYTYGLQYLRRPDCPLAQKEGKDGHR
jgi:hypothetical protein